MEFNQHNVIAGAPGKANDSLLLISSTNIMSSVILLEMD